MWLSSSLVSISVVILWYFLSITRAQRPHGLNLVNEVREDVLLTSRNPFLCASIKSSLSGCDSANVCGNET